MSYDDPWASVEPYIHEQFLEVTADRDMWKAEADRLPHTRAAMTGCRSGAVMLKEHRIASYNKGCRCGRCREAGRLTRRALRARIRKQSPLADQYCPLCDEWFVSVVIHESLRHSRQANRALRRIP